MSIISKILTEILTSHKKPTEDEKNKFIQLQKDAHKTQNMTKSHEDRIKFNKFIKDHPHVLHHWNKNKFGAL